jgi:hypothetical protein
MWFAQPAYVGCWSAARPPARRAPRSSSATRSALEQGQGRGRCTEPQVSMCVGVQLCVVLRLCGKVSCRVPLGKRLWLWLTRALLVHTLCILWFCAMGKRRAMGHLVVETRTDCCCCCLQCACHACGIF